jgi:hypothetical protein
MTKSARTVAREAPRLAQETLPTYASKFSRHAELGRVDESSFLPQNPWPISSAHLDYSGEGATAWCLRQPSPRWAFVR